MIPSGLLCLYKPPRWSSADCVAKVSEYVCVCVCVYVYVYVNEYVYVYVNVYVNVNV